MSTTLDDSVTVASRAALQAPRVVEVVGPAGAGKSSLCRALTKTSAHVRLATFPDVRSSKATPFFLWHGLRMSRNLFQPKDSRTLTFREFAWLCILDGWAGILQEEWASSRQTNLLDQGPVYLISELSESGPRSMKSRLSTGDLRMLPDRWASVLDAIVWLDAPDDVLVRRIRSRKKEHIVKNAPDQAVVKFIRTFRETYEQTLSMISRQNASLKVLRFNTAACTAGEIASNLAVAFSL